MGERAPLGDAPLAARATEGEGAASSGGQGQNQRTGESTATGQGQERPAWRRFEHWRRWSGYFFDPVKKWSDDRCPSMAASIAFYASFSLAPTLVIIIAVASFFYGADAAQGHLVDEVRGVVGRDAAAGIQAMITSAWEARIATGTTLISLAAVVIGASATFSSLNTALNVIWCAPATDTRGSIISIIRVRLISFAFVIGIGLLVVALLLLDAALAIAGQWFSAADNLGFQFANVTQRVLSLVVLAFAFAALLKLLPDAPLRWRYAFIGGVTAAVLFSAGKNLFAFYLAHAGTANTFGAAGSLAIVLMWLYYSAAVFLLGAEVAAVTAGRENPQTRPVENP